MKNKKGFTLVELLAVIMVLAITIMIATIGYKTINMAIRKKQYENIIKKIELASLKYASETDATVLTVKMLIEKGLIEADCGSSDSCNKCSSGYCSAAGASSCYKC